MLIADYGQNVQPEIQVLGPYLGEEVVRWSEEVKDDGSHRYCPGHAPGAH